MFENPRRGRQARHFATNVPKILDLKSSSEQIFSENWRWVSLIHWWIHWWCIDKCTDNALMMHWLIHWWCIDKCTDDALMMKQELNERNWCIWCNEYIDDSLMAHWGCIDKCNNECIDDALMVHSDDALINAMMTALMMHWRMRW